MSFAPNLALVVLATYALCSALLAAAVGLACRAGAGRALSASRKLLALRLLPSAGAALLALTVVMPAFLLHEPPHEAEAMGPVMPALALIALLLVGDGVRRGWRASAAADRFLRQAGAAGAWPVVGGRQVEIVELKDPIVAVVGALRPRIVAARHVVAACSVSEFTQVVAHEAAHVSARDNLKRLLLLASPDPLAWLPAGAALAERWRMAAEFEADERATGADRRKRVELAAALVKVARLSSGAACTPPALSMTVATDDVEARVRRLLAPSPPVRGRTSRRGVAAALLLLLLPLLAVPWYGPLHQLIETLVAFGR